MAGKVGEVSDSSFEAEVLKSTLPVLVDFWAPWCGPCKSIAPIIDELATQYDGKVKFFKMNVDENPKTPSSYNVRGIPNLVLYKAGQVVDQVVGAVPKEEIVKSISKAL